MKIAILGAGMAGCALAYFLKQSGHEPVIYEANDALASGASGNSYGLYNPRFTAFRTPESDFYVAAFCAALRTFAALDDIDWDPCDALHLINDEKKQKRFSQTIENWGWHKDQMRLLKKDEASEIAGVALQHDAMYLPQSGTISPKKLCAAYARGIDIRFNSKIESLDDLDADIKILACGPAVLKFAPDLPMGKVRGQITTVKASDASSAIKCNICYGGYVLPARDGLQTLGATFQPWLDHSDIIEEDDQDNIRKLAENIPGLEKNLEVVDHRASVRATSKDHFPMIGQLQDGLYISAAHGSHGVLSTLMGAHLLVDMILERPKSQSQSTIEALSPLRFF